jgi:starch phosphorylase
MMKKKVKGEAVNKPIRVSHPLHTQVDGFDSLAELDLDMCWTWNHATDDVWRRLDPALWETTHNPYVVLKTELRDRIEYMGADPAFPKNVDNLVQTRRQTLAAPAWFQENHSRAALARPLPAPPISALAIRVITNSFKAKKTFTKDMRV